MAGPGNPGRKSKKDKAREANIAAFDRASDATETSGDYAGMHLKPIPKSHRDFNRVTAYLNHIIEKNIKNPPPGISLFHALPLGRLYDIGMRKCVEYISRVKCPQCGKSHLVRCPKCKVYHEVEMPDAQMEKNSIDALKTVANKTTPNLAAITQDININVLITSYQDWAIRMISKYVPIEEKSMVIKEMEMALMKATDADFTEVTNGKR